jgi:hypothetical protein
MKEENMDINKKWQEFYLWINNYLKRQEDHKKIKNQH